MPEIQAGITAGGHIYNSRFTYRTAKQLFIGLEKNIGPKAELGAFSGIEHYQTHLFIPVFLQFRGMLFSQASGGFLSGQVGYSIASSNLEKLQTNYDYGGGFMFATGYGYRFIIRNGHAVLINLGYKQQFAKASVKTEDKRIYRVGDNFNLIYFSLGFRL